MVSASASFTAQPVRLKFNSTPDFSPAWTCQSPFWDYDDMDACHRQSYFELYPVVAALVICALYWCWCIFFSKSRQLDDQQESSGQTVFHPRNANDPTALIKLRTRMSGDRLRLLAELVINTVILGLSYILAQDRDFAAHYDFAPHFPVIAVGFLAYIWVLSLYRYVCAKQLSPLIGSPYCQLAYLYSMLVSINMINWYSQITHRADSDAIYYSAWAMAGLSLVDWFISFSSPVGDHVPRSYISCDNERKSTAYNEPSPEADSSLLRASLSSWTSRMILGSRHKALRFEDVMDLVEDDHSYRFVEEFNKSPRSWGFFTRVLWTSSRPLSSNSSFGITNALLKSTPTIFIQKILQFLETRNVPTSVAWLYVFMSGFSYSVQDISSNQAFYQGRKLTVGLRALVVANVFRKALYKQVSKSQAGSASESESSIDNSNNLAPSKSNESKASSIDFNSSNTGTISNLMSVDSKKSMEFFAYVHDAPGIPLSLFLSIFFLYNVLGWSAFVAVLIMIISIPFNMYMGTKISQAQEDLMAVTDLRVEKTNEILDAIRIIKCYAWERRSGENVFKLRDQELKLSIRRVIYWMTNDLILSMMPIFVVIGTFWCYVQFQGGNSTTSVAFTALSVFSISRMPLMEVSETFLGASSAYVSGKRISTFLKSSETDKYEQSESSFEGRTFIGFRENASFAWATADSAQYEDAFRLRDLNIEFALDDLTVIVGPTGSGKTSLLMALLGEMHIESGKVYLPTGNRRQAPIDPEKKLTETVAYVPQEAWSLNDTIKRNILFGHDFDKERYRAVLDACELRRDLEILEQGDQTLIGDKGIALSGGQKQRVSLARAIYSNSRYLISDDCSSAVDSHTSVASYNKALNGLLVRDRTVILVSHNVALTIGKAGHVVVMDNGRVLAQGTPAEVAGSGHSGEDELVSRNAQSAVASRIASHTASRANSEEPESSRLLHRNRPRHESHVENGQHELAEFASPLVPPIEIPASAEEDDAASDENQDVLHDDESMAEGAIPLSTYLTFLRESGSPAEVFSAVFPVVAVSYSDFLLSWWVRAWAAHMGSDETEGLMAGIMVLAKQVQSLVLPQQSFQKVGDNDLFTLGREPVSHETMAASRYYSLVYFLIGLVVMLLSIFRDFIVVWGTIRASRKIFRDLLTRVMHARTHFFDTTPSGRIVNRFSQDMVVLDQEIGPELSWFAISCIDGSRVALVVSWVTPLLIPVAVIATIVFLFIGQAYLSAARESKRMESVTNSPIFQQFSEALSGSVVIRAYGDVERFMAANMKAVDSNHRPYLWLWIANRWLAFWCTCLSISICVFAAAFIVLGADYIDPGMAGISLSSSTSFGDAILWSVRMYAMCEISMNSVERVHEYLDVEQEAPSVISDSRPPPHWPSRGEVEFKNLSLQYTDDLPMVIKNVSFKVKAGQKVGIVGRTGAGKSTIITALFRLLEPASGTILIDDLDISTIGLEDLRSGLSIIPQDPTLFKGTLRSNLDLFSEYTDENMFRALSYVNLVPKDTTPETAAETLAYSDNSENTNQFLDSDTEITEGGHNLSQGQRQLICLARAISKEPRILLLDEATASIDYSTDAIIQETIRKQFQDTTILTIAHRLRTIADYDMILVLEQGTVAQYDHPYNLLQDKTGLFYSMCAKSGELDVLVEVAKKAKEKARA